MSEWQLTIVCPNNSASSGLRSIRRNLHSCQPEYFPSLLCNSIEWHDSCIVLKRSTLISAEEDAVKPKVRKWNQAVSCLAVWPSMSRGAIGTFNLSTFRRWLTPGANCLPIRANSGASLLACELPFNRVGAHS
jgi:hypothetical protein